VQIKIEDEGQKQKKFFSEKTFRTPPIRVFRRGENKLKRRPNLTLNEKPTFVGFKRKVNSQIGANLKLLKPYGGANQAREG
jgi:hypothetical protein